MSFPNYSRDNLDAARLLLRWMQHEAKTDGGNKFTLELIAEALGMTRDRLNRFLAGSLNSNEIEQRYTEILPHLQKLLSSQKHLPAPVKQMMERVFGPAALKVGSGVIGTPTVQGHEALPPATLNDESLQTPLVGLSILVRVANEVVINDHGDPEFGWSISLVNVPPAFVQRGTHHPLFKLRQRGASRNYVDIEGVVVLQRDRFSFQGIDTVENKPFTATLPINPDDWRNFRNSQNGRPVIGSGVMLGLSSARAVFAGLFDLVAIPKSVLGEKASESQKKAFLDLYERARDAIGVRDMKDTLEELNELGIKMTPADLEQLRERSRKSMLLTAT